MKGAHHQRDEARQPGLSCQRPPKQPDAPREPDAADEGDEQPGEAFARGSERPVGVVRRVLGHAGHLEHVLGGLLLGTVETFVNGSQWSTYKDAIAFAILIIILLFRPAGLLGRAPVEKV